MAQAGLGTGAQDSNHVEAHLSEGGLALGYVLLGDGAYGLLLARRDGFGGISEGGVPAQLDLHEHQSLLVGQDQVYLPVTGAIVALDEFVSLRQQMPQRKVLAPITDASTAPASQARTRRYL